MKTRHLMNLLWIPFDSVNPTHDILNCVLAQNCALHREFLFRELRWEWKKETIKEKLQQKNHNNCNVFGCKVYISLSLAYKLPSLGSFLLKYCMCVFVSHGKHAFILEKVMTWHLKSRGVFSCNKFLAVEPAQSVCMEKKHFLRFIL